MNLNEFQSLLQEIEDNLGNLQDRLKVGWKYEVVTKWNEVCYCYYEGRGWWREEMGLEWFSKNDIVSWKHVEEHVGTEHSIERMKLND